jgi:DHA1 family 2-module integral membrane pump EmrD-like MFS transporter
VTRFFQGAGCGVCLVLGRTIFADVFSGEKMAIAIAQIAMFTVLSPIFAPTIGGYIQHIWDWQANFRFLGGFILLSAIVYFFLCPETNKHKNPDAMKPAVINAHYQEILANKLFLNTTLLSGLVASINMVYQALSPFIFQLEFHLSPVFYGWIAGFIGAVGFSARMISVHMLKTYGRIFQLKANTFLLLFGSLLMFAFQQSGYLNMYGIIGFIATMIFTQTSLAPVLSSYALKIFPEKAGVAGSIYSSGQMLVSFAISAIASSFTTNGVYILSMTFLILAIVVGRFTLKLLKTDIM